MLCRRALRPARLVTILKLIIGGFFLAAPFVCAIAIFASGADLCSLGLTGSACNLFGQFPRFNRIFRALP